MPEVKNSIYKEYDSFAKAFEADVLFTIEQDLNGQAMAEKQAELAYEQKRHLEYEKHMQRMVSEKIDNMLQLYFLLPHKKAEEEKKAAEEKKAEEKKNSPSKQAPLPPRPVSAVKTTLQERQQLNKSTKQASQIKPQMLKDDLSVYPEATVKQYKFFGELLQTVQKANKGVVSNDPNHVREVYLQQQASFK